MVAKLAKAWKRNPKKSFKGRSLPLNLKMLPALRPELPRLSFAPFLVKASSGEVTLAPRVPSTFKKNSSSNFKLVFHGTRKTYLFPRTISSKRIWALWLPFQFLHGLVRLHLCSINNLCCRNDNSIYQYYITYCSYSQMLSFPCNFTYIWIGCHPNRLPVLVIGWGLQHHHKIS